jgi:hypothetical protein
MWQIGIGNGDGLQIHDFCNGKKYSLFNHDILYYYVKTWIIIAHDYVTLNAFQVQKWKNSEIISCTIAWWVLLNKLYSLDSIKIIPHVFIIY